MSFPKKYGLEVMACYVAMNPEPYVEDVKTCQPAAKVCCEMLEHVAQYSTLKILQTLNFKLCNGYTNKRS